MTTPTKPTDEKATSLAPNLLGKLDKTAADKIGTLLGIEERPKDARFAPLSLEQEVQLKKLEEEALSEFRGDLTQLESALGMLRMGFHFGWRVLYLIHSKKTIRNYETILNIKIRDVFPETGPSSYRSIGLNLANRFSNFWKVVSGEIKIPKRQDAIK